MRGAVVRLGAWVPEGELARAVAESVVKRLVDVFDIDLVQLEGSCDEWQEVFEAAEVEVGDAGSADEVVEFEGVMHLELDGHVVEMLGDVGFIDRNGVEEVLGELDVMLPLESDADAEAIGRRMAELEMAAAARENPGEIGYVFLDRDGVLNREGGHVTSAEALEVLPGVGEAIARLNEAGIGCSVVTNQSGLARGIVSEVELGRIHQKLVGEIAKAGGRIEKIYVSPYLDPDPFGEPDEGLVTKWVKRSDQRKPRSGMLFRAARDLGVRLGACVMVGDSMRDLLAAEGAGMRFYGVRSAKEESFGGALELYADLGEVVGEILKS